MKGAPVVALREGHAASRSRWSACTMVTSCEQHARRIPGLELMFKASGELLEKKLQTFARGLGCNWLSVVTGPKGSDREEHVLQYLERHLPQMTEGRRWRLLLLDAYAPQMSDSVRRLCWQRGYIVIIHGGGATGVTQVNDTDLHQHLRKTYVEHEMAAMIKAARLNPNSTPVPKCEQCVTWMANVWSNSQLLLKRCKGFQKKRHHPRFRRQQRFVDCQRSVTFLE